MLAIKFSNDQGTRFLLLSDHPADPGWAKASDFDLLSDEVPSSWRIRVGGAGHTDIVTIAPASWLVPRFFEDYWSDDPARFEGARATFQRELEAILRESA